MQPETLGSLTSDKSLLCSSYPCIEVVFFFKNFRKYYNHLSLTPYIQLKMCMCICVYREDASKTWQGQSQPHRAQLSKTTPQSQGQNVANLKHMIEGQLQVREKACMQFYISMIYK